MEKQKLYVLAKIRKLPTFKEYGEYEVVFLYSDKEKNFKRIADCTPEIQKRAVSIYCPYLMNQYSDYYQKAPTYCFDCASKEMVRVCEETMDFKRFLELEGNLALDHIYTDTEDKYSTRHLISNFAYEITCYGSEKDNGKVFVKCGKNAKIEMTFSEQFDEILNEYVDEIDDIIDEILNEYFGC